MPLDDKTILADEKADVFTNRFEFMAPSKKALFGRSRRIGGDSFYLPRKASLDIPERKKE